MSVREKGKLSVRQNLRCKLRHQSADFQIWHIRQVPTPPTSSYQCSSLYYRFESPYGKQQNHANRHFKGNPSLPSVPLPETVSVLNKHNPDATTPAPPPSLSSPLRVRRSCTPWIYRTYSFACQIPPTDCAIFLPQYRNGIILLYGCIYCRSVAITGLGISGCVRYGYILVRLQFTPP